VEQHLRDQYSGKTLVLHGFYQGERLRYDSAGMLTGSAVPGDWSVDGFVRVTSVSLSSRRLTIEADRLFVLNDGQAFRFHQSGGKGSDKKPKKESRLRLDVDADGTGETVGAALSKIFLISQDRLADLVPDPWKPCVLAASTGKGEGQYKSCRFTPEFSAIPGVAYSLDESSALDQASIREWKAQNGPHPRIGRGLNAPRLITHSNPEFSEEARSAKYQGTVIVSMHVDNTGQTRNLRIVHPVGMGLDRKALETVSQWRFDPAMRDGEPVDMDLAVEVDFHLY
jgi:TonB family protein